MPIILRRRKIPVTRPIRMAPTTSTTMMLALGDALAMATMRMRGFSREDFQKLRAAREELLAAGADAFVDVQPDGAMTSVKFHAWRLTQYAVVLHTDVDVLFLESPLPALSAAFEKQLIFQAAASETAKRGYMGINTHMMLLRPSLEGGEPARGRAAACSPHRASCARRSGLTTRPTPG